LADARFAARVTPKGELVFADPPAWRFVLQRWKGRDVVVEIAPPRRDRTNRQNRWYRGVIVPAVAEELSRNRPLPLSNDQAHHVLKCAFIGTEETALGPAPISTKTLTTVQFSDYCERIRAHAASEWGRNIPSPDEAGPEREWPR
jgi:hypothetical protein